MTDPRTRELSERLAEARGRLDAALAAAGRTDEVDLVVVTKFHPVADVARLARLGVRDIGENRVQEAAAKVADLAATEPALAAGVRWNMIGHIQSNKAAAVAGWADRVHSVDSVKVADGLERGRARAEGERDGVGPLPVLLQLSLDGDTSRGGVDRGDLPALADHVAGLAHLRLAGLMVVPPLEGDPASHFADAAGVREALRRDHPAAVEFSAGMSGDLEAAIGAGSTCVRVGTAILGPRPVG
ncbi:YggS family pyridoxal phosphate-dependent enzyme [uncultured Dietzia sp.]|jgi:pyridoxal phosphate enzyme (YggS family)|uniref:YggS family pyridoxal phosphate-dependent enzyme n=1 Tax=uncultured Dietzia sp. TaxID=395519 RepID=UPI0026134508|nr:YggS family pyridoxal phosphate-dependent enzyme [uncultured Dietzia sp.]HMT49345.1 YggS family pyridoxal phosphate-dependent enzyme [Dietzia sp.]